MLGLCIIILLSFPLGISAQGNFINQYWEKHQPSSSNFIDHFPFEDYLNEVGFEDLYSLEKDRNYIEHQLGQGDIFLYHLGTRFATSNPPSKSTISQNINIGESLLHFSEAIKKSNSNDIYATLGFFILGKCASYLENQLSSHANNWNNHELSQYMERLEKNKIHISRSKTNLTKVIDNIKIGRFDYLINRIHLKLDAFFAPIGCQLNVSGLSVGCALFALLIIALYLRNLNFILGVVGFTLLLILLGFKLPSCHFGLNTHTIQTDEAKFNLEHVNSYFKSWAFDTYAIKHFNLKQADQSIGEAIWLDSETFHQRYITHNNVYAKFKLIEQSNKLILTASGGYTNAIVQPEGLTLDHGQMVNAVLLHDRDALVIISKQGTMEIINLELPNINLPFNGPTIKNPLDNLIGYAELLQWAKNEKATIFQTHLLAAENQLRLEVNQADEKRERRIVTRIINPVNGQISDVIFNITEPLELFVASQEIIKVIQQYGFELKFMFNLDVGAFNIFQFKSPSGTTLLEGPIDMKAAPNLLIYYLNEE